jgi:hypothetical protein
MKLKVVSCRISKTQEPSQTVVVMPKDTAMAVYLEEMPVEEYSKTTFCYLKLLQMGE